MFTTVFLTLSKELSWIVAGGTEKTLSSGGNADTKKRKK